MDEAVPHLALLLLLAELVSTRPGHTHENPENKLILGIGPLLMVIFLDIFYLIATKTEKIDNLLNKSLVKVRPHKPKTWAHRGYFQRLKRFNSLKTNSPVGRVIMTVVHVLGYILIFSSLICGLTFKKEEPNQTIYNLTTQDLNNIQINKSHNCMKWYIRVSFEVTKEQKSCSCSENDQNITLNEYALCEGDPEWWWILIVSICLIIYPLILLALEITELRFQSWEKHFFGSQGPKNLLDLLGILMPICIGIITLIQIICCSSIAPQDWCWMDQTIGWESKIMFMTMIMIFIQFQNRIFACLPSNGKILSDQYLHMLNQVAWRCFKIMLSFLPFLMTFAAVFQGNAYFSKHNQSFHCL